MQSQADQNSTAIADKQDRVTGVCPPEQAIAAINADGSVICEADTDTDTDTTYSAGEGLSLQGTTFSLDKRAAFRASGAAVSQNLILGVSTKLIFNAEEYDSGGNYSPADSAFVVPEDGFYRFDCSVESQTSLVSLATVIYLESNVSGLIDRKRRDGATSNSLVTLDVSANVFLSAGEIITCHFSYDGSNFQVYSYRGRFSRFSGFRIH